MKSNAPREVRIIRKGRLAVAVPTEGSEPLTAEAVRRTQVAVRAERSLPPGRGRVGSGGRSGGGRPRRQDVPVSEQSVHPPLAIEDGRIHRARQLRQNMTKAERQLWRSLRGESLGARFRRQVPIGPYIVDFACFPQRLVIEIDGGQHLESTRDRSRDAWLEERGFRVLRFWNHEVLKNLDGVLQVIASKVGTAG